MADVAPTAVPRDEASLNRAGGWAIVALESRSHS
jgi:hypothetical protein